MKHLCRAIIWTACFLELSDDDIVDPGSAVKALEDMASILQQATNEEKHVFAAVCVEEAAHLQSDPPYARAAEFVRDLPAALGL